MKEIENDSFSIYLNERETEAIIKNEPYDSKYSVLSPSFFPLFPYLLLGKIKTSFKNIQTVSEGVGLLIGDDIVLTSAHNIYQGKLSKIKSIEFIPLMTGAVRLLKPVQCRKYSMLKTFQDLKNKVLNDDTVNNSDILNSDFAICFLKCKLGREIKEMFNLHNDKHFDFWPHGNRLFSFFIHKNKDIKKGTFSNGYQPNNVGGKKLKPVTGESLNINGNQQSVWSTGKKNYVWNGIENKYYEVYKKNGEWIVK